MGELPLCAINRLILNTTGLDTKVATLLQGKRELKEREDKMTKEERAVAMELSHLLEDRARMSEQVFTQQIRHLSMD